MYVHTHHVAKAVGQEHGVGTSSDGCIGVAFHQAELLQPLRHQTTDGKVYIGIFYPWLGHFEHVVVTSFYDAVDFKLALTELAVDGHCPGVV